MPKSPDAFRTISEVADWLGIQAHVLRFWESKFTQVKPVKRAGGRRYYRPGDMLLLGGIKQLLHEDGLTIKGVQKVLREDGMSHVSSLSPPLDEADKVIDTPAELPVATPEEETGVVLNFETPRLDSDTAIDVTQADTPVEIDSAMDAAPAMATDALPETVEDPAIPAEIDPDADTATDEIPHDTDVPEPTMTATPEFETAPPDLPDTQDTPEPIEAVKAEEQAVADMADDDDASAQDTLPSLDDTAPDADVPTLTEAAENLFSDSDTATDTAKPQPTADDTPDTTPDTDAPQEGADLPAFLRRPLTNETPEAETDNPAPEPDAVVGADPAPTAPQHTLKPRIVDMPKLPNEADFDVSHGVLARVYRRTPPAPDAAAQIAPLLERLTKLRDAMAARRGTGGSGT